MSRQRPPLPRAGASILCTANGIFPIKLVGNVIDFSLVIVYNSYCISRNWRLNVKLSTKGEYGVRTMVDLAGTYGAGPVSLALIAQMENISLEYLEQLISVLRKRGLVVSTRGAYGGYQLALAPEKISVGDIVRALEGPIAPMECASEDKDPGCCDRQPNCSTRVVWEKLRESIAGVLDTISLADLCREKSSAGAGNNS